MFSNSIARRLAARPAAVHAGLALAACAGVLARQREVLHKIADVTLVYADALGFAEGAAAHPLGFLEWIARLLTATGLTAWGIPLILILVALAQGLGVLAVKRGARARCPCHEIISAWLPALLVLVPMLGLGADVWLLRHPHFIAAELLLYAAFAGLGALCGRLAVAVAAVLPFAVAVLGRVCWGDLPWHETVSVGFPFFNPYEWKPYTVAPIIAFGGLALLLLRPPLPARLRTRLVALPPRLRAAAPHALPPLAVLAVTLYALAPRDTRDQLRMERLAAEGDFAGVLRIAPKKPQPERMETAWRILALYRTDRLDRDLWRFPMVGNYRDTLEEEMIMEGPLMLFQYGLVQPARRWIFESCMVKGWQPAYFRILGDAATVTGEAELARRNFRQLARCPFRGDLARRRLEALAQPTPPENAFSDLADVAGMHEIWTEHCRATETFYFGNERVIERFVYDLFLTLKSCPPPMLKMFFACALLSGQPELLRDNRDALAKLYPTGNMGPVFLEVLK